MEVVRPLDPSEFLARAGSLLLADEARHNLIFGVAGTLRDHPGHYPEHRLWLVLDDDTVVAAAVRTPPHNLIVAGSGESLERLAASIDEELPGATGAVPEVEAFGRAWEAQHGATSEVRRALWDLRARRADPARAGAWAAACRNRGRPAASHRLGARLRKRGAGRR